MTRRQPTRPAPPPPPQSQLGFLTADVLRLLRADFAARASDMPLTPALYRLLFNVHRRPGCRQVELAEWLEITPVTISRMIDRLEKQGLVRRESEPGDRRVYRVFIAAEAGPLLAQINAKAELTRDRAFRGMSAAQREALLVALARVRENLQADPVPGCATKRRKPGGR